MNIFHKSVISALNCLPKEVDLANTFLDTDRKFKRYVVGKNEQSKELIQLTKVDGVIDDFNTLESHWNGIPIISSKTLPSNSIVVNCSTSISPVTVYKYLRSIGVKRIAGLNEIIYAAKSQFSKPWFLSQMIEDYQNNYSEWFYLFELLFDEQSKKTLLDVVCYRMSANISYMKNYTVRLKDQYFDDVLQFNNGVFIDVGGFDGETTELFCHRYPNYKKVYFFEPSILNMEKARNRLSTYSHVQYIPMGLSDHPGSLFFNDSAGSASSVIIKSGEGSLISVTTLDKFVNEQVEFIKMDIEGWELKALYGSREHIVKDKPKMAIAVYHNASDFREIAKYILSLNPDYKIYLRHYTEGWSETVMYFIP